MNDPDITPYEGGHIYILDNHPEMDDASEFEERSVHDQKNKIFEKLSRKYFNYEIHNVSFPKGSKSDVVQKFFEDELSKRAKNEIVIIYFHGGGGDEGKE